MDYQLQFESISNRVVGLSAEALLNCLISGLRPDIQLEMAVLQPHSLSQSIGLAKLLETKFLEAKKPLSSVSPNSHHTSKPPNQPSLLGPPPKPPPFPIKYVSPTEMQERRSKGLCFNCDDKFSTGHLCKNKQFLLLLTDNSGTPLVTPSPTELDQLDPNALICYSPPLEDPLVDVVHFQLSKAALLGPPSPRTLLVHGRIHELHVTFLIDSGSSHNIMQPHIAELLGLPVIALNPFSVIVGNGESINCSGSCQDVPVTLFNQLFHIPFFILPIHGPDLVLGVQWLPTLGPFLSDYSIPSIQFAYNQKPITLTGSAPNNHTSAPSHNFVGFF